MSKPTPDTQRDERKLRSKLKRKQISWRRDVRNNKYYFADEDIDYIVALFAAQTKQHQIELIEARCDELEDRLKIQFTKKHWEMLSGEVNSWAKCVDRRLSELKSQKAQLEGDI